MKGAVQYNHRSLRYPDTMAGANDLAGFMEAPEINAKKKMSRPTIPPITIPLKPLNPFVWITTMMTAINNAVTKISTPIMSGIE